MKLKFVVVTIVLSFFGINKISAQLRLLKDKKCVVALIDKAFSLDRKGDFYLFLPVETVDNENARLMIKKSRYINYLLAFDSVYSNVDSLKTYTKDILLKKKKLFFDEYFFKQYFKSSDFVILTKRNPISLSSKSNQDKFLKKYLSVYNKYSDFYEIHWSLPNPTRNYKYICERLFSLNYLVVEGKNEIIAVKVKCK